MKKFLVSMLIVLVVVAQVPEADARAPKSAAQRSRTATQMSVPPDALCKSIRGFATSVMGARQSGAMSSKLFEELEIIEPETIRNILKPILKPIILDAYAEPKLLTPEYVKRAIEEFSIKWFVWCVNTLN